MYDYIKGILISKNHPYAVIENNGIGYQILCNSRTLSLLDDTESSVKIYTKLIHKEDSMMLAGFKQKEDRVIFDILTSVSGIGVKVAMLLLDEFSGSELINAVINDDYKLISKAKGVGPKLAQKIILEVKDKLTSLDTTSSVIEGKINASKGIVSKETLNEVQNILQSLGYTVNEYTNAVEHAAKKLNKDNSEDLLKETLTILSNN